MNLRRTPQTPPAPAEPPTARAFLPRRRRTLAHLAHLRQAEARLHAELVEHPHDDDSLRSAIARIRDEQQPR